MWKWLIRVGLVILLVCLVVAIPICEGRLESVQMVVAVENDNITLVKSFLEKGIDPDTRNCYGTPILHISVYKNHGQMTQLLLDNGADINIRQKALKSHYKDPKSGMSFSYNLPGITALHVAVSSDNLQMAKLLIKNGADVNAKPGRMEVSCNAFLFSETDTFTIGSSTALQLAVLKENLEMAKLLLDHGAEVNMQAQQEGEFPPLHCAVIIQNPKMMKLLLANGADVDGGDYYGDTPLHHEMVSGPRADIVKLLLEHGADTNVKERRNRFGLTPLHKAIMHGPNCNPEVVELLLEYGADINGKSNSGITPLIWAVVSSNTEMAKLLISKGTEVNTQSKSGTAPLHLLRKDQTDLVQSLLDAGADINIKTNRGDTPLDIAIQKGNTDIAELLRKHGAKTGAELSTEDQ